MPLLLLSSIKGLQIDDVEGDKESWGEIDERQEMLKESDVYDIYDDLIDELVEGRAELAGIDVREYLRDGINDDMETDKLTDLPENLQQLQQQLLQVRNHYRKKKYTKKMILQASRKPVTSLSIIEVDNSTGWPWYAANLPPSDFYDCLFIFYSCTDFEEPGFNFLKIVKIYNQNICRSLAG